MNNTTEPVLQQLSHWEIILRLACAMAIGVIVGMERGRSHRPAGLRTHMLVALGACVVMITSHMLFMQFRPFGATPDPARLGAQVISGVGFLGAGTIMREGLTIKGLTTAASVWTVACLGLAAGAGYYFVALGGALAVYIILTAFEALQRKMNVVRHASMFVSIDCTNLGSILHAVNCYAVQQSAAITHTEFEELDEGGYRLTLTLSFNGARVENDQSLFLEKLTATDGVSRLESTPY